MGVGKIPDKQLVILVDSGSTCSFMDAKVATKLKLSLLEVPEMTVTIADGRKLIFMSIQDLHGGFNTTSSHLISKFWRWRVLILYWE